MIAVNGQRLIAIAGAAAMMATAGLADEAKPTAAGESGVPGVFLQATGEPMRAIIVPDDTNAVARFAAEELARYIKESVNVTLPILAESAPNIPTPAFLVGASRHTAALGLDTKQLKPEGFFLKTTDKYVVIAGDDYPKFTAEMLRNGYAHPRATLAMLRNGQYRPVIQREAGTRVGTLFGVYTFLRKTVGVEWFFPGPLGEVVPRHERLVVGPMDQTVAPSFEQRKIWIGTRATGINELPNPEVPDWQFQTEHVWAFRSRLGMSWSCQGNHTMSFWGRLFGKDHPDYFALVDGKRQNNWGWNGTNIYGNNLDFCWAGPGAIRQQIEEMRTYFTQYKEFKGQQDRHPSVWIYSDARHFPIGANDGHMRFCECEDCRKWYQADGSTTSSSYHPVASDLYYHHVAEVARVAQKEFPDKFVVPLAYSFRAEPPRKGKLPDNVKVVVAAVEPALLAHPAYRTKADKLYSEWRALCEIPMCWLYYELRMFNMNIPLVMPHLLGGEIKARAGQVGGFFFCQGETATGPYTQPELYVATQLMWDSSQDIDALLDRFYRGLYGDGADDVKACYDYLERVWIDEVARIKVKNQDGIRIKPLDGELRQMVKDRLWTTIFTQERLVAALDHLKKARKKIEKEGKYSPEWIRLGRCEEQLLASLGCCVDSTVVQRMAQEKARTCEALKATVANKAPTVDGVLSDDIWQRPPDGRMVQIADAKKEATPPAEVWIARDAETFYVAVKCSEPNMSALAAEVSPSPGRVEEYLFGKNDDVEIFLDTENGCQTYYQFAVDAAGQVFSKTPGEDGECGIPFRSAVGREKDGWTVEAAIPFTAIGGAPRAGARWGINVVRTRRPKVKEEGIEYLGWFPSGNYHAPQKYGRITF